MASQKFLNNFDWQLAATVLSAPVTGTPDAELNYTILSITQSAAGVLTNPTGGDWYTLTMFKRSGSVESQLEVVKVIGVDELAYYAVGECRIKVLRAQEGTTAQAYVSGDYISLRWTKGSAENMVQRDATESLTNKTINKVAITAPATGSTLTIANGKTLTASNTLTLTGTDGSSLAIGAGGTAVTTTTLNNATLPGSFTTLTSSGNTTLGDSGTDTVNMGAGQFIKDASGNVQMTGTLAMGSAFSFRNKLINGGFDVWQRGTSGSILADTDTYTADRMLVRSTGSGITWSKGVGRISANGCLTLSGAAGNTNVGITQRVESKQITKPSALGWCVGVYVKNNTGATIPANTLLFSAGVASTTDNFASHSLNIADNATHDAINDGDWGFAKYLLVALWAPGPHKGMYVTFTYNTLLSGQSISFSEFQLEAGTQATPFESRPYSVELAMCHRYYKPLANNTAYDMISPNVTAMSATDMAVDFGVADMRTTPSLTAFTLANTMVFGIAKTPSSTSGMIGNAGRYVMTLYSSGMTAGQAGSWQQNGTPGGAFGLTAEL